MLFLKVDGYFINSTLLTATDYQCHTQWMSDGVMYVIASPVSRASGSPKRLCFAYASDQQGLSESPNQIVFSSRKDTCIPSQDDAHFAFNATFFGKNSVIHITTITLKIVHDIINIAQY